MTGSLDAAHRIGPLHGLRVIELGGIGPCPFAGMVMAEMGADVLRVDRPRSVRAFPGDPRDDLLNRGKRSVCLDLKQPAAVEAVLQLAERADVLIEGNRPGVAERLGLGPADCRGRNPGLVYGRVTGWGQTGPLAARAGHDVNYIGVTGALHAIGPDDGPPQIPLNLVGDFGGGGTYLVMGVLAGLWHRARTGQGTVIDAAMIDGVAHMLTATHSFMNAGKWFDHRGRNVTDGGSPYYTVYKTLDGEYMAVGAYEQRFYAELLAGLGLTDIDPGKQNDEATWPTTRSRIAEVFASRTGAEWTAHFQDTDACVTPVLGLRAAKDHPQMRERATLLDTDGLLQAAPAPKFQDFPSHVPARPPLPGEHTRTALADWGVDPEPLVASGAALDSFPDDT